MTENKAETEITLEKLIVSTLNPEKSPELVEILRKSEIVVADIDYTFLDISKGHDQGVKNVEEVLDDDVAQRFNQIFHLMVEGHRRTEDQEWKDRERFNHIVNRMKELQKKIVPKFGLKYWSKGTMILIAAQELEKQVASEKLTKARDAYWEGRAEKSTLYPDSLPFVKHLEQLGIPLYLMTSSYHILQIGEDLSLTYDPEASRRYKDQKMQDHLGFEFSGLTIGDPVDKPDSRFFERVFDNIKKDQKIEDLEPYMLQKILVLGDSDRNDLQVPREEFGCKTILIKR